MTRHQFLVAAALATWLIVPADAPAQVWTEVGDAGGTAATAQSIGGASLTRIDGTLSQTTPNVSNDMDVYRFVITSPATFSASTAGATFLVSAPTVPANADTMIALFNSAGQGIAFNDDTSAVVFESTLPAGNALYANLPVGQYLLAISLFDNRHVSPQGVIFPGEGLGVANTTNTGVFNAQTSNAIDQPINYRITLTGVAPVPEPGTLVLCSAAGLGAWGFRRRQRRAA